jgi:hypothetical protein
MSDNAALEGITFGLALIAGTILAIGVLIGAAVVGIIWLISWLV